MQYEVRYRSRVQQITLEHALWQEAQFSLCPSLQVTLLLWTSVLSVKEEPNGGWDQRFPLAHPLVHAQDVLRVGGPVLLQVAGIEQTHHADAKESPPEQLVQNEGDGMLLLSTF